MLPFVIAILAAFVAPLSAVPASQPAQTLKQWFNQLADRDPDRREEARINLMGIDRSELPKLQKLVEASRPLQPSQVAVLHDIVTHVYLAGEPYEKDDSGGGFLGLRWGQLQDQWAEPVGVMVELRLPGFVAYRMLREGDVIVGVKEMSRQPIKVLTQLQSMVRSVPPGTKITLLVLRGGQVVEVPLRLDAPPKLPGGVTDQFVNERNERAEDYWTRAFEPLLDDASVSSSRP